MLQVMSQTLTCTACCTLSSQLTHLEEIIVKAFSHYNLSCIFCFLRAVLLGRVKKCDSAAGATKLWHFKTEKQEKKALRKCKTTLTPGFWLQSDQEMPHTSSLEWLLSIQSTTPQYAA